MKQQADSTQPVSHSKVEARFAVITLAGVTEGGGWCDVAAFAKRGIRDLPSQVSCGIRYSHHRALNVFVVVQVIRAFDRRQHLIIPAEDVPSVVLPFSLMVVRRLVLS